MGRHTGKTAVITGGTSGIGLATAKRLLDEGARVIITGRNPKAIEVARAELGDRAIVVASDTSSLADIDVLAAKVKEAFGTIDLLFVNAGIAKFVPFEGITAELYDETQAINTRGAFFTVQRLAPLLGVGSSVVLNTSVVDEKGLANTSMYAASKAALRSLARTLSTELLPKGVRVNAVSPGPIVTPIYDKMGIAGEARTAFEEQIRGLNPMKRFGDVDEVAKAVLFLGFDATFTTGAELPVDGGMGQL
jgi:NAD(P)-dependent dehydrogenase (short-subunit alcohol dehydrogenase family)